MSLFGELGADFHLVSVIVQDLPKVREAISYGLKANADITGLLQTIQSILQDAQQRKAQQPMAQAQAAVMGTSPDVQAQELNAQELAAINLAAQSVTWDYPGKATP